MKQRKRATSIQDERENTTAEVGWLGCCMQRQFEFKSKAKLALSQLDAIHSISYLSQLDAIHSISYQAVRQRVLCLIVGSSVGIPVNWPFSSVVSIWK